MHQPEQNSITHDVYMAKFNKKMSIDNQESAKKSKLIRETTEDLNRVKIKVDLAEKELATVKQNKRRLEQKVS